MWRFICDEKGDGLVGWRKVREEGRRRTWSLQRRQWARVWGSLRGRRAGGWLRSSSCRNETIVSKVTHGDGEGRTNVFEKNGAFVAAKIAMSERGHEAAGIDL